MTLFLINRVILGFVCKVLFGGWENLPTKEGKLIDVERETQHGGKGSFARWEQVVKSVFVCCHSFLIR